MEYLVESEHDGLMGDHGVVHRISGMGEMCNLVWIDIDPASGLTTELTKPIVMPIEYEYGASGTTFEWGVGLIDELLVLDDEIVIGGWVDEDSNEVRSLEPGQGHVAVAE